MIQIDKQVCSMEQAIKLKELGIDYKNGKECFFQWIEVEEIDNQDNSVWHPGLHRPNTGEFDYVIISQLPFEVDELHQTRGGWNAFTVAELGVMLGKEVKHCYYHHPSGMWTQEKSLNPDLWTLQAHCYANWLIYCIMFKRITVEQVNILLQ